jgi:hypothetical protein
MMVVVGMVVVGIVIVILLFEYTGCRLQVASK